MGEGISTSTSDTNSYPNSIPGRAAVDKLSHTLALIVKWFEFYPVGGLIMSSNLALTGSNFTQLGHLTG